MADDFPLRPQTPDDRVKKLINTNHSKLEIDPIAEFHEYQLTGLPVGVNRTQLRKLFEDAIQVVPWLTAGNGSYATDGLKTIVAWNNLHVGVSEKRTGRGDIDTIWGTYDVPEGRNA